MNSRPLRSARRAPMVKSPGPAIFVVAETRNQANVYMHRYAQHCLHVGWELPSWMYVQGVESLTGRSLLPPREVWYVGTWERRTDLDMLLNQIRVREGRMPSKKEWWRATSQPPPWPRLVS